MEFWEADINLVKCDRFWRGWQKYSEICRWLGNIWNLPLFGFKPLWPSESDEGVISLDVGPLVRPSDRDHLDHMPQVYMIALCFIEHQSIAPCCFVLHSLYFYLHLCKGLIFKNRRYTLRQWTVWDITIYWSCFTAYFAVVQFQINTKYEIQLHTQNTLKCKVRQQWLVAASCLWQKTIKCEKQIRS